MKRFLPVGLLFAATDAFAHPGHGRPGFIHSHELADLFADGALIFAGVTVLGLLCWRVIRALKR